MDEGQIGRALTIALALRHYSVEYIRIKEEGDRLLTDLRAKLPQWQIDAAMQQIEGKLSPDQEITNILEHEMG